MNNGIEHIINAKDGLTYIREILGEKYTKVFSKLSITLRDLDIFNTLRYNSHKNVEKRSWFTDTCSTEWRLVQKSFKRYERSDQLTNQNCNYSPFLIEKPFLRENIDSYSNFPCHGNVTQRTLWPGRWISTLC